MLTISTKTIARIDRKSEKRVFIVDDEPDITLTISAVLECNGFEVCSFNDPELALSSFKPLYFDLAILDVKMSKMGGFELYHEIRRIDCRIKVCFLTATNKTEYDNNTEQQRYCELNKDMFLQKPISNKDLLFEMDKRIGKE